MRISPCRPDRVFQLVETWVESAGWETRDHWSPARLSGIAVCRGRGRDAEACCIKGQRSGAVGDWEQPKRGVAS